MIEPVIGASLAAIGAGTGIVGLVHGWKRPGRGSRRRSPMPITSKLRWLVGSGVVAAVLPGPRAITVPLALLLALRVERLVAARTDARRRRAIDAEIPQLLDLLAAGSAAGLSAPVALGRAVTVLRGPLGTELRASLEAVDLGARWREELADLTRRLALPDLRRAVAVLTRAETLGASLTAATRELAADARSSRRSAVAERARAAPVKMLFPLVFLVLPAFLLLTVVPVLLTTVRSIR